MQKLVDLVILKNYNIMIKLVKLEPSDTVITLNCNYSCSEVGYLQAFSIE